MALITCKSCGKTISDTTSVCIHCGAPLQEPIAPIEKEPTSDVQNNDTQKDTFVYFKDLQEEEKDALQYEFWQTDKRARAYVQKEVNLYSYLFFSILALVLPRALLALRDWVKDKFFEGNVYSEDWLTYSTIFAAAIAVLWIICLILWIYTLVSYRSRSKRQTYHRRLQKWLLENKGIHFTPNFHSKKDQEVFEKIDLNTL